MQSNALLFCLACVCHGRRIQANEQGSDSSSLTHGRQQQWSEFRRRAPSNKLSGLLLALHPSSLYRGRGDAPHSSPLRTWSRIGHGVPAAVMNQETAKLTLVEQLKAKAMRAALKAERASLEAEKLQLEVQQMKLKRSATEAPGVSELAAEPSAGSKSGPWRFGVPAEQALPIASPSQISAMWAEHKGKVHRFINRDYKTLNEGSLYLCRTREYFRGTRIPGSIEGSFLVSFTLPGKDSEPKTVELLQTSPGNPSFAAVKVKLLSFAGSVDNRGERDLVEEDVPWHKKIGWASRFNRFNLPFSRFEDDELPKTRLEVRGVDPDFNRDFVEDDAFEMVFGDDILSRIDIQPGDIIRGVSLPEINRSRGLAWWELPGKFLQLLFVGSRASEGAEEGMLMLNGRDVGEAAFDQVLAQYIFFKDGFKAGIQSEIVLLIERPEHRHLRAQG